jgi:hypothetical protein
VTVILESCTPDLPSFGYSTYCIRGEHKTCAIVGVVSCTCPLRDKGGATTTDQQGDEEPVNRNGAKDHRGGRARSSLQARVLLHRRGLHRLPGPVPHPPGSRCPSRTDHPGLAAAMEPPDPCPSPAGGGEVWARAWIIVVPVSSAGRPLGRAHHRGAGQVVVSQVVPPPAAEHQVGVVVTDD